MFDIQQYAVATADINTSIRRLETETAELWIRDTVHAVHVWHSIPELIGAPYVASLAFNYDIIQEKEFEFIQVLEGSGTPVTLGPHLPMGDAHAVIGVSHVGVHVPDYEKDVFALVNEILRVRAHGFNPIQVSLTMMHESDKVKRQYMYAFCDTRALYGTWLKLIMRLPENRAFGPQDFMHWYQEQLG